MPGVDDQREERPKGKVLAPDTFCCRIEEGQGECAAEGGGQTQGEGAQAEESNEGHGQIGIEGVLPAAPGYQQYRQTVAVSVDAVVENAPRFITGAGLVLIEPRGKTAQCRKTQRRTQRDEPVKEQPALLPGQGTHQ